MPHVYTHYEEGVWNSLIVAPIYSTHTGTPGATPYGGCPQHLNLVEANMVLRFVCVCVCVCVPLIMNALYMYVYSGTPLIRTL